MKMASAVIELIRERMPEHWDHTTYKYELIELLDGLNSKI